MARISGKTKMKAVFTMGGLMQPQKTKTIRMSWGRLLDKYLDRTHREFYENRLLYNGFFGETIGSNKSIHVTWGLPGQYKAVEVISGNRSGYTRAKEGQGLLKQQGINAIVHDAGSYYIVGVLPKDYKKIRGH